MSPVRERQGGARVSEEELKLERQRVARAAMALMERRAEQVTKPLLVSELRIARARIDQLFPDEIDLAEAVAGEWFAPKIAVMDEVLASGLPPRRKMYEFFARRFVLMRDDYRADPAAFRLYIEVGEQYFEAARSYIDLADHLLCEIIVEAQAEGHFPGLGINEVLSLINQAVVCYIQPYLVAMLEDRLTEAKLARIIDALFDGLSAEDRGAKGVTTLRAVG
ncbi:MAG: hypothetical protein KJZ64_05465 [Sphingomonadaceae bacterium]|nr:hypothetical protein [Sphingomonadaceae bacterium]